MLKFVALIWAASAVKISRKKFDEVKAMNLTEKIREDFRTRYDWYYNNDRSRSWWYSSNYNSWHSGSSYYEPTEVCAVDS